MFKENTKWFSVLLVICTLLGGLGGYGYGFIFNPKAPVTNFLMDINGNLDVNSIETNTARIDALTSGRIPIAGANGLLGDSSNLRWTNGNTLNAPIINATSSLYVNGEKYTPSGLVTGETSIGSLTKIELTGLSYIQTTGAEPSIFYDNATGVFKMIYRSGWGSYQYWYADSINGVNWAHNQQINSLTPYLFPDIIQVGSNYYYFGSDGSHGVYRLHSTDMITWTLDNGGSPVLAIGTGGDWDTDIVNTGVWYNSTSQIWYLLYEASNGVATWNIGVSNSTTGLNFTKYSANPVLTGATWGGPSNGILSGDGYVYFLIHGGKLTTLPTDIYLYKTNNLITYTQVGSTPIIGRTTIDEGVNYPFSQVADPFMLQVNDNLYIYYSASTDGANASGNARIKLAVYYGGIEQFSASDVGTYPGNQPTQTLSTGLVLYLPMDEGSGSKAYDWSGYCNDGTVTTATYTTGEYGSGLYFNASLGGNQVTVANTPNLNPTKSVTYSMWIKMNALETSPYIFFMKGGFYNQFLYYMHDGLDLECVINIGGVTKWINLPSYLNGLNTWTLLTTTYDGNNLRNYKNGQLILTTTAWGLLDINSGGVTLGAVGDATARMTLDEVRIYNRALSPIEVSEIYTQGPLMHRSGS